MADHSNLEGFIWLVGYVIMNLFTTTTNKLLMKTFNFPFPDALVLLHYSFTAFGSFFLVRVFKVVKVGWLVCWYVCVGVRGCPSHTPTHPLTHSPTHSYSLTHIHTHTHTLAHSLTHSLTPSLLYSFTPSLTHSLTLHHHRSSSVQPAELDWSTHKKLFLFSVLFNINILVSAVRCVLCCECNGE